MGIGRIDPEYAIREGWARDSDDEIYMDGYNAFIQVTTRDGTSGFSVKNAIGAVAFSSNSIGDGYIAKDLSVGEKTTTLRLQVSEGSVNGYVLTADAQGNATWQPVSDSAVDLSNLEEAVHTILKDLDGYHPDITGTEHYNQLSQSIQDIIGILDGYDVASSDIKVKVSDNDTTADYLGEKLVGGDSINIVEQNDGSDEYLEISIDENYLDGYIDEDRHRDLDQLVHEISEDSFEEITYLNNNVSNITIWTNSEKTKKIREQQFLYDNGNRISQITTIQYDEDGSEVEQEVEDFTFNNNKITSITRNLTLS